MTKCEKCDNRAMRDSSYCVIHEPDIDGWYEHTSLPLAHESYRISHFVNGLGSVAFTTLYEKFERRALPDGGSASANDLVYFLIQAAASGVVGNLSYELMKKVVKRVFDREPAPVIVRDMDKIVFESDYENLRQERHGGIPDDGDDNALAVESQLIRKRRNLLQKD